MTPDAPTVETIRRLYGSGQHLVYEFAGAGSLALAWLHAVGGSSRMVLEASDRYSAGALAELIGAAPEKAVSSDTAARMAEAAYRRAVRLSDGASPCLGLGCTASIATDRGKRGEHACHVAVRDPIGRTDYSIVLTKGARDRAAEETTVARLVVHALASACGVESPSLEWPANEAVHRSRHEGPDPVPLLLAGSARTVTVHPADRRRRADEPFTGAVLSGSFNPLHCGHETMLRVAGKFLGTPVAYELPVINADKPPLAPNEIQRRVDQFRRDPVILTRAPLFVEKAALFPGSCFVLGYDTAVRLVDPRYYGGEPARDKALGAIQARGCRFLVAARPMPDGIRTLADVPVPATLADLFLELPRSDFLLDLSSTELRGRSAVGGPRNRRAGV